MVIHVVRTLKYEEGRGLYEDTPKTASSTRDIPLTEDMLQIIETKKNSGGYPKLSIKMNMYFTKEIKDLLAETVYRVRLIG